MLAAQNVDLIGKVIWTKFRTYPQKESLYSAGYDGLLKAEKKFDKGRDSQFRSFAYALIRNAIVDYIRAEERQRRAAPQLHEVAVTGQQTSVEDQDMVQSLMENLPEEVREIVLLKEGYGFTFKEIMQQFPEWKQSKLHRTIAQAMEVMKAKAHRMVG